MAPEETLKSTTIDAAATDTWHNQAENEIENNVSQITLRYLAGRVDLKSLKEI